MNIVRSIPSYAAAFALGLISAASATVITHTFAPGNLEGWSQASLPGASSNDYRFFATSSTFGNRMNWQDPAGTVGGLTVTDAASADARGAAHNSAILRSPTFTLNGVNALANMLNPVSEISVTLLGGMGTASGPSGVSDIPANSLEQPTGNYISYLGVGLRRVDDDAYLLWGRRTSNAQSNNWQTVAWDEAALAAAIAGDAPGTLYTVDLIDAAHGDWGWVAIDNASFTTIPETSSVALLALASLSMLRRRR